jgi:hypothetical protein
MLMELMNLESLRIDQNILMVHARIPMYPRPHLFLRRLLDQSLRPSCIGEPRSRPGGNLFLLQSLLACVGTARWSFRGNKGIFLCCKAVELCSYWLSDRNVEAH